MYTSICSPCVLARALQDAWRPEWPNATSHLMITAWPLHSLGSASIFCPLSVVFYLVFIIVFTVWASLVAKLVKNPPAMRETWVHSLGWEGPLEKGKATHSKYSGLENSVVYIYSPWGHKESDTTEQLSLHCVVLSQQRFCSVSLDDPTAFLLSGENCLEIRQFPIVWCFICTS